VSFSFCAWLLASAGGGNSYIELGNPASLGTYDWRISDTAAACFDASSGSHTGNFGGGGWPSAAIYHMLFVKFDASTHTLFASVDDSSVNVTVSGVTGDIRNTGTFKLIFNWLNGSCDEFYYWSRALTSGETTRLYNSGYGLKYPFVDKKPANFTLSYMWAVTNAGGYVTASSSNAVWQFFNHTINSSLDSKFTFILGYGPDTIQSALIPYKTAFFQFPGNDMVAEAFDPNSHKTGWTTGDQTVNGLAGTATTAPTKYAFVEASAQSSATANVMWPTINDAGLSVYIYTAGPNVANGGEFGFFDTGVAGTPGAYESASLSAQNNALFGDLGSLTLTNAAAGYYSINRDSSTSAKLFYGNRLTFGTYVTTNFSSASSSFRSQIIPTVGAVNHDIFNNTITGSTNLTTYASAHTHFTEAQTSNEMYAVNLGRFAYGGGFIPSAFGLASPTNSAVIAGNNRTFYANDTSSTTYQWQKNGVNIANATTSSLTINSAAASDFADYACVSTINGFPITSASARLYVVTTTTVSNWLNQCFIAGSATISSNTAWSVDTFWNGLVTDSLDSVMIDIDCFVPDTLIAAITPLLATTGNNSWVNHNFVIGDLSVNGLTGDGSTKYLDTGIKASDFTINDTGAQLYGYTVNSSASAYNTGVFDASGANMFAIALNRSGNTKGFFYDFTTSPASVAFPGNGFFSFIRNANNSLKCYWANSGNAHAQIASNSSTTTGTLPAHNIFEHAGNSWDNSGIAWCADTHSYWSTTKSLTSGQDSSLFSRVQTLRQNLGGGFR
jgi:hypothetical protein